MAQAVEEPGYAADEKSKPGYIRLKLKIDGLKVKSLGLFDKLLKKHPHPEGKNAEIGIPTYHSRGFELNVKGGTGTGMQGAKYRLKINQLPFDIEPEECYITAEDGWIFMFLKKVDENESWKDYLMGGLETGEKS